MPILPNTIKPLREESGMELEIVALLTLGVAAIWVPLQCLNELGYTNSGIYIKPQNVSQLYSDVRNRANHLHEKVALLETHSPEYFNSLHEVGLGTLISIRNTIQCVLSDMEKLSQAGEFDKLGELCRFILSPTAKEYSGVSKLTSANLKVLSDWEKRSNEMLVACVIKLSVMSSKSETIGLQRVHKRRPTTHSLDELKQLLREAHPDHH